MFKKIIIPIILFTVVFGSFIAPVNTHAQVPPTAGAFPTTTPPATEGGCGLNVFCWLAKGVGEFLVLVSSFELSISGFIFDEVMKQTVIRMSENLGDSGLGAGINAAWISLRNIANLAFIFVLLYAAFSAMFSLNFSNFNTMVRNIIIMALLINFSLFFSKFIIDASNVVAIGFYKSVTTSKEGKPTSISEGYKNLMGLKGFYSPEILKIKNISDPSKILLIGVMTSVFFLVTAVVLAVTSVMFLARFILLIFIMILSPLAFIAYIIPAYQYQFKTWLNMLINQSVFAPIFFALTWVVFKIAENLKASLKLSPDGINDSFIQIMAGSPQGSVAVILNFIILLGFAIAALVISKQIAARTAGFSEITGAVGINKIPSVIGGATFGRAAAIGRGTAGAVASRLSQSQYLNRWAGKSLVGEKVKLATEKVAKSSFDLRQTKVGQGVLGATRLGDFGKGKEGGYESDLAAQTTKKEKFYSGLKGDEARSAYARRTIGATGVFGPFTKWYKQGGSRPNHIPSLFGTMGRGNRIISAKILGTQLQQLTQQRDTLKNNEQNEQNKLQNLQNRDSQLNQQLNTAQTNLITLQNIPINNRQANYQQQLNQTINNIQNVQQQIQNNQNSINQSQTQLQNIQAQVGVVDNQVQYLDAEMDQFGIRNPANLPPLTQLQQLQNQQAIAAGKPAPHKQRPLRADEQNY